IHDMRASTRTGADNIGGLSMARSRFRGASRMTGSLAFRMLIPATSVGSDFKRISRSSRATAADTNWRGRRHHEKGRRSCRDARCADDADNTFVFAMPRDVAGRRPGMSVIVGTRLAASGIASRLREALLAEPSDRL